MSAWANRKRHVIYWIRLFALIFSIVLVVAIIGSLLPRSYDFHVSQDIQATPDEVFEQLTPLTNWPTWSQFGREIAGVTDVAYSEKGRRLTWQDPRGEGQLWITDAQPPGQLDFKLKFANFPEMESQILIEAIAANEEGTSTSRVTWKSSGVLPSGPFYGYFAPFYPSGMRAQYGWSLSRLKELCETGSVTPPPVFPEGP